MDLSKSRIALFAALLFLSFTLFISVPQAEEVLLTEPSSNLQVNSVVAPQDMESLVDEVFRIGDLKSTISDIRETIVAELQVYEVRNGVQMLNSLHPDINRILTETVDQVCSSELLESKLRAYLEAHFDPVRLNSIIQRQHDFLFERIIQAEHVSRDPDGFRVFITNLGAKPLAESRRTLIARLEQVSNNSQLIADISSMTRKDSLKVLESVLGQEVDWGVAEQIISQMAVGIQQQARENVLLAKAYDYRDISDEDLSSYVDYWDSEDGRWYSQILIDSILDVTAQCSHALRDELLQKKSEISPNPWAKQ